MDEQTLLLRLARKYIWWKPPEQACAQPDRVIAQVMDMGDYADVQCLAVSVGDARLRRVLDTAEAGQLSPRSWAYWHYRLGMAEPGELPSLPSRRTA